MVNFRVTGNGTPNTIQKERAVVYLMTVSEETEVGHEYFVRITCFPTDWKLASAEYEANFQPLGASVRCNDQFPDGVR
jgi:hypothetical protein